MLLKSVDFGNSMQSQLLWRQSDRKLQSERRNLAIRETGHAVIIMHSECLLLVASGDDLLERSTLDHHYSYDWKSTHPAEYHQLTSWDGRFTFSTCRSVARTTMIKWRRYVPAGDLFWTSANPSAAHSVPTVYGIKFADPVGGQRKHFRRICYSLRGQ